MAYGIDYEQDQQYAREKSRLHCMWRRSNPVKGGAAPLDRLIKPSQCGGKNNVNTRHTILDVQRARPVCGQLSPGVHEESRLVGRGHYDFPPATARPWSIRPARRTSTAPAGVSAGLFPTPTAAICQNGKGNNRMYRWYLANPVRFQKSLKVEIQDIGDFGPGSDDFTSVAFWYQEEPHQPFSLQPFAERTAPSKARVKKK